MIELNSIYKFLEGDIIKVGFIGAGKVGLALGKYFSTNNVEISGYYNRSIGACLNASSFTKSKSFSSIKDVVDNSTIIFITVCDDAIGEVDNSLKELNLVGKTICHTSGSFPSNILANAKQLGANTYSVHPIFAFTDSIDLNNLGNVVFSIEGGKADDQLSELFSKIGNSFFYRQSDENCKYHLASVFVSNLALSLIEIGTEYLQTLGLSKDECVKTLMPLIKGNVENIENNGFSNALTGPVARGDILTIKNHINALSISDIALYKILSINILKILAKKSNLSLEEFLNSSEKHMEIFKYLGGSLN